MPILDYHTHRAGELRAQIRRLEREIAARDAPAQASTASRRTNDAEDSCAYCAGPLKAGAWVCPHCRLAQPAHADAVRDFDEKLHRFIG